MSDNPFSAPTSTDGDFAPRSSGMPTLVVVIAVLGLLVGGYYFFANCCGIGGMTLMNSSVMDNVMKEAGDKDPEALKQFELAKQQVKDNFIPIVAMMGVSALLGAALLLGSIGTLMRKEWGRSILSLSCMAGVAIIVFSIAMGLFMGGGGQQANLAADQKVLQQILMIGTYVFMGLCVIYFIVGWKVLSSEDNRRYFS